MPNSSAEWSEQQKRIFEWFENGRGNAVVRARAGTGKTTTLVEGIDRAPEKKILLAAFNKSIASELTQRIRNPAAEAKTLHALGFGCILRARGATQVDQDRGSRIARQAAGDDVPNEIVRLISRLASRAKNTRFDATVDELISEAIDADLIPDEEFEESGWNLEFVAQKAHEAMELACVRDGTVDFDDMVYLPARCKWIFARYDLVAIDEAQDLSHTNLYMAQRLCKKDGRIIVVGDDRQAIYGFRGADSGSIDRLKRELGAQELGLTITYRCPRKVVELAKALVPDYESAPGAPEGAIERCSRAQLSKRALPGDFVLSRKNAPLASVCLSLLKEGKRARIEGKDIGKQLVTLIGKFAGGRRGRSIPSMLEGLKKWRDRELARAQKMPESKRDARIELINDQHETIVALCDGLSGPAELIARIETLFADSVAGSYIVCSSAHRAKGRESDNVFLLKETFSTRGIEECNIQYVALTRAKKKLVWVDAANESGPPKGTMQCSTNSTERS